MSPRHGRDGWHHHQDDDNVASRRPIIEPRSAVYPNLLDTSK
jgi:hypothetical protein